MVGFLLLFAEEALRRGPYFLMIAGVLLLGVFLIMLIALGGLWVRRLVRRRRKRKPTQPREQWWYQPLSEDELRLRSQPNDD